MMESEKTSLLFKSEVETFQPSRRGSVSPPDRPEAEGQRSIKDTARLHRSPPSDVPGDWVRGQARDWGSTMGRHSSSICFMQRGLHVLL